MAEQHDNRVAVYAGTFDPLTYGHRDLVVRASTVFDRVIVAVAESTSKATLFAVDERVSLTRDALAGQGDNIEVTKFDGLLVNFVRSVDARVIIRGLRAVSDYEYEYQMAMMNQKLAPDTETVFLMASQRYSFITSSIVKEVARHSGDVSCLVPENIAARLIEEFN